MSSKKPLFTANRVSAISHTCSGWYCGCFMSSVTMRPRSSCLRVAWSRSEANCAKAASSRYCASARRTPPPVSLRFMILVWAAPPTRDTEMPALMAGRMPALNKSVSKNICPSVIEMTFVGTNAVTSPAVPCGARPRGGGAGFAFHFPAGEALDVLLVHARAALEQARVQVEHVARVGLAARRPAQEQRYLAVRPSLLRQIVVDDERVLAAVAEVLAHGAARVRRYVLHGGGLGGGGGHDDGVRHRAVLFELPHDVRDGRGLLPDRDVHAEKVFALLVDDGVDGDRGLAGLAVADDEFALAAADRHHGVDRLEAGLHRLRHRFPPHHARSDLLDDVGLLGVDGALAVDRLAQRIHHPSEQLRPDRHGKNPARGLDDVTFGDLRVFAQDHRADRVALEVERQAEGVLREFEHLALHHVGEAVDAADAIGH